MASISHLHVANGVNLYPAPDREGLYQTATGDLILPDGPRVQDSLPALHDQPRVRQIHAPAESASVIVEATTDRVVGRVGSVGGDLDLPLGEAEVTRYCVGGRCAWVMPTLGESDVMQVTGTDLYVAFVGSGPTAPGMLTLDLIDPYAPTIEAAICQLMAAGQPYVGPCVGASSAGPRTGFWTDVCVSLSLALIPESEQWRVDETVDCYGISQPG